MIPSLRAAFALALGFALATGGITSPPARAQSSTPARRPVARAEGAAASSSRSPRPEVGASGSWWIGTAGMALALAACGWASLAARRFLPKRLDGASNVRVVGRTTLSPKHSVYLLDIGGRVLIVGTGPQGAPSLLGEMLSEDWSEPSNRPAAVSIGGRLDVRLGETT